MAEPNGVDQDSNVQKENEALKRLQNKAEGPLKFSFSFFFALHIITIIISGVHFNECPVEPSIPSYILAIGVLGAATKIITLFRECLIKYIKINIILSFITTAEFVVFIVGSYYVYKHYAPNFNPQSGFQHCNKTLYMFAFIYITIVYCLLLLCILGIGCFILVYVVLVRNESNNSDSEKTAEIPVSTK